MPWEGGRRVGQSRVPFLVIMLRDLILARTCAIMRRFVKSSSEIIRRVLAMKNAEIDCHRYGSNSERERWTRNMPSS
jgi:hypothetical protein